MGDINAIDRAIAALPPGERAAFRRRSAHFDAAARDRRIDADAAAGDLDALASEALADFGAGSPHLFETHRFQAINKRFVLPALLSLVAAAATAATPTAPSAAPPAETAAHTPSIKETLTAVSQISHELKLIEVRMGKLEQSLAGVDASLKPVAAIAQPAALRGLILLAAACGAGLIVLHALLRRWSHRATAPAARKE
jgi:hypothetical protein